MKQCSVTIHPGGRKALFPEGKILMDALADMDVMIQSPCGGRGICGKCAVKADGALSPATEAEKRILSGIDGKRLACQAEIRGPVMVQWEQTAGIEVRYPAMDPDSRFGAAVDIGTTSVQVSLVPAGAGGSVAIDSFINPQRRYGHDVISRIAAARDGAAAADLTRRIRHAVKNSILRAFEALSLRPDRIGRMVISGNTTMLYLFFGLDVAPLGSYPYRAGLRDIEGFSPADAGMAEFAGAEIQAMPIFSAFIGGDAVGGFADFYTRGFRENVFFIDLGTNGEIILANQLGEIHGTSCAMGPALEGMNISCGMSAGEGAITRIRTAGNALEYEMIGSGEPVGISGTALIDIAALLLEQGALSRRGLIAEPGAALPAPALIITEPKGRLVRLWDRISLSQGDVRSLQLAKGASLAASRLLLRAAGCRDGDIRHVIIAGALGQNLDRDKFMRLGFIPDFSGATFHVAGNSSLGAAERVCREDRFMGMARAIRDRMTEQPLAASEEFSREFISALDFP
jgi:uncharacterized 2Fe-2S/4Fe-4S cluster protein (DUF4445 family)